MMSSSSSPSSRYEALRQANIARNNDMLEALGLGGESSLQAEVLQRPVRKRRRATERPAESRGDSESTEKRFSRRLKLLQQGVTSSDNLFSLQDEPLKSSSTLSSSTRKITSEKKYGRVVNPDQTLKFSTQISEMLNETDFDASGVVQQWDASKVHQHLTLSKSRRTVVTTGCAGYGGVLSCKSYIAVVDNKLTSEKSKAKAPKSTKRMTSINTKQKVSNLKAWRVKVLSEGVGGFAVGVARRNTAYPYKSLGNRGDAWVLHSSGALFYNRTQKSLRKGGKKSCEYGEGDIIEINVYDNGRLLFKINNDTVEAEVVLPSGEYVLCCQPYMGGGARLVISA